MENEENKIPKPEKLKRPASAYLLYINSVRSKVKLDNPDLSNKDLSKKLAEMWAGLPEDEKKVFQDQFAENKKVFELAKAAKKAEKKPPKPKKNVEGKPKNKKAAGK
jgi:DNA-directed RNA polymerase specialized sigma24 family protein